MGLLQPWCWSKSRVVVPAIEVWYTVVYPGYAGIKITISTF
jgi:hypothetical protein